MSTTKDKTPQRGGTYEPPLVPDYSDLVELTVGISTPTGRFRPTRCGPTSPSPGN